MGWLPTSSVFYCEAPEVNDQIIDHNDLMLQLVSLFSKRIEFKIATLAYKALHNEVPAYLSELLHIRQSSYNLRSTTRTVLTTPRTRTTAGCCAFTVAASQSWYSLPQNIQSAVKTDQFKKLVKTHLFQK